MAGKRKASTMSYNTPSGYKMAKDHSRKKRATGQVTSRRRYTAATRASLNARTGGFLGLETKYHDAYKGTTSLTNVMTVYDPDTANCLNGIAQGVTQSTRDGNRYLIKKIQIRGEAWLDNELTQSTVPNGETVRIFVVHDQQTNGALCTGANVISTVGFAVNSFRNLEQSSRFKVLGSKNLNMHYLTAVNNAVADTVSYGGEVRSFDFEIPCHIPVQCTATGATVAAIADNSIHVLAATDGSRANFRYTCRVRFIG